MCLSVNWVVGPKERERKKRKTTNTEEHDFKTNLDYIANFRAALGYNIKEGLGKQKIIRKKTRKNEISHTGPR